MSATRRVSRALATLPVVMMAAIGCSHSEPAPPPLSKVPWTGLLAQEREVWSAEPGIDLVTGPAVVIRAYLESRSLASQMGDIDYVYPGFKHAVAPNDPAEPDYSLNPPPITQDLWPEPRPDSSPLLYPAVGTGRSHILRIDTSGRQVTAVVCGWDYGTAYDIGDGRYSNDPTNPLGTHNPDGGIFAQWVAMTAPAPDTSPPLPPQRGPAPAPTTDVFDGWRIVGYAIHGPTDTLRLAPPQWPTRQADTNACVTKAPDPPQRRVFLADGVHPRSDFPTQHPYPGWPIANPA